MRVTFTMGRLVLFDFRAFEIEESNQSEMIEPDVIVVHHHEEEDEDDGPGDLFGKGK
jgi:CRISPR/Cas system CMR subunit Cmr6 (Cas7 group RAMP superfamily)